MSPSNEYSGMIPFRIHWFDLLAVQGTLKSLLQHHSSKASILWCSAFFVVQLSHPYMTTGKTIDLTRWIFVSKGICFSICCLGWRRKRQPTPVFMPGKSHGPRSLVGYNPWGRKESDTTERLLCVSSFSIRVIVASQNEFQCSFCNFFEEFQKNRY